MFGLFGFVTDAVIGKPGYFEYCKEAYRRERADEAAKEAVGGPAKSDSESGQPSPSPTTD